MTTPATFEPAKALEDGPTFGRRVGHSGGHHLVLPAREVVIDRARGAPLRSSTSANDVPWSPRSAIRRRALCTIRGRTSPAKFHRLPDQFGPGGGREAAHEFLAGQPVIEVPHQDG